MAAQTMAELWCDLMHESPMLPIHGRYQCHDCGRVYRVQWMEADEHPKQTGVPVLNHVLASR
jgi:hypothetical protein